MSEDNGTTTIETKWGKISGRKTSELIAVLSLCALAVVGYGFHKHEESTKDDNKQFREVITKNNSDLTGALKDLAVATQGQVKEQRVMNCMLAIPQSDRRQMLAECERIAK